jgi:hypothetical protein
LKAAVALAEEKGASLELPVDWEGVGAHIAAAEYIRGDVDLAPNQQAQPDKFVLYILD